MSVVVDLRRANLAIARFIVETLQLLEVFTALLYCLMSCLYGLSISIMWSIYVQASQLEALVTQQSAVIDARCVLKE